MNDTRPMSYTTEATLDFIRDYKRDNNGNSPSLREIAAGIGVASTAVASHHVVKLEQRGYIRRVPYRSRWIELVEEVTAATD